MHNARIRPSYDFLGITQRLRDAICFHTESLHCRCLVEANGESPPDPLKHKAFTRKACYPFYIFI
jgi:hypothetical protein